MFELYDNVEKAEKTEKAKRHIRVKLQEEKKIFMFDMKTKKPLLCVAVDKEAPDMLNEKLAEDIRCALYDYGVQLGNYYDGDGV